MKGKKLLSLILSLVLLLSVNGVMPAKAADYTGIKFTGIAEPNHTKLHTDNWQFYLTADGYSGDSWNYKYESFTYEIDGKTITTGEVSSTGGNGLWGSIPTSEATIENGTIITIKAGDYDAIAGTTVGIRVTEDFQLVAVDGYLIHTQIIDAARVEVDANNSNANEIYFSLYDEVGNAISTGVETWDYFVSPADHHGNRVDQANWNTTYSGVRQGNTPVNHWSGHFKNHDTGKYYVAGLNATEGTTVTVRGHFVSSNQSDWAMKGDYFIKELIFTYDGSSWSPYDGYTYNDITITNVEDSTNLNGGATAWFIYTNVDGTIPGDGWQAVFNNVNVLVGDDDITGNVTVKYAGGTSLFFEIPTTLLSATPAVGTRVTIKAGEYTGSSFADGVGITGDLGKGIRIAADYVMEWNGTKWVNYVHVNRYNGSLSLDGAETVGNTSGIYLKGTDEMPAGGWDIAILPMDELSGIWINDVKQTGGYVKKYDSTNCWYYVGGFDAANEGDTITIKGNFGYDNNVVTLEELTLEWAEGSWAAPVTVNETEENVVLDVNYSDVTSGGNAEGIYITTTDSMPAPGWETIIAPMRGSENGVFINGSATKSNVYLKKISDNTYYVCLGDMGITAVDGDTVTIKGKFQYNGYVVDFNSTTFHYNGQKWATTYTPPVYVEYEEVALEKLNAVSEYTTGKNEWMFYIDVDGTLPGDIDVTQFPQLVVSVDGTEYEMVAAHSYQDTLWIGITSDILPQFPGKDVKVIVKAGKYLTVDATEGIEITEDFTIYVNDYGMSDKKFLAPYVAAEKNITLSIDRDSAFGGGESGIYLNTGDHFKVDTTWSTLIRSVAYDAESGVFYNGKKTDAILKKFADGKIYVDLLSAGISAQDKDEVVIKGMFYLDDYAVAYKEYKLYYNGKSWNETYFVQVEKYVDITGVSVNKVSEFLEDRKSWVVYINVNGMLPGEIDKLSFEGLEIIVDGKKLDTLTYHSYQDCLYFAIPEEYLSADAPNGKEITVKAGKALSANRIDGINWTKDFSLYTFLGTLTEEKPTDNTKWQDIAIKKLPHVMNFNKEAKTWEFFLTPNKKLTVEDGTDFFKFPITVNGKKIEVTVVQAGDNIYFNIPEEKLPGNTKTGTLTISKGAKAIANAGRDGIRITEDFTIYLYNGVWSEEQFDKTTTTSMEFQALQNATYVGEDGNDYWNVYFWSDTKVPGTSWYQRYEDFTMYYNGKEYQTRVCKADSSNGRLLYFMIDAKVVGAIKDGDIVTMKPQTMTCGGYAVEFTNNFALIYKDGIWSEYVESDVQAPADDKMLWEVARFDSAYIPISENGTVNFTSSDKYNKIMSMDTMKDYTISFSSTKMDDEMGLPPISVVLRGNAIDEETAISTGTLYGYVVRFSASEKRIDDTNSVWTGNVDLWKNGYKVGLVDHYRIAYANDSEKAYYGFNEKFDYEFSIYNVTETCVCITVKVNGEVVLRHYDHASDDPMDPAVNAGTFGIFAESLGGIYDGIYEVEEVLATKTECKTGEAVWVSGSYPYVTSKTEFSLDKEGATVANGVFKATEPGEYTLSCSYDGKEVKPIVITVTEAEVEAEEGNAATSVNWPVVGGGIAGALVIAAGGTVFALRGRRKKRNAE